MLVKILGIDPGGTTGWARLEYDPVTKKILPGQVGETKDTTALEIFELIKWADIVVMEDFKVRPDEARKGSFDYNSMIAPQVIGSINTLCQIASKTVVLQQPAVKPVAYGFANRKYVKGAKGQHRWDAQAHGVYYLVKSLGALPVGFSAS